MPPKKKQAKGKADVPLTPLPYNLPTMKKDDMRQYARMLERDIDKMREFRSFCQNSEDALVNVDRRRQSELRQQEEEVLKKEIEIEKIRITACQKLQDLKDRPKYDTYKTEERREFQAENIRSQSENRTNEDQLERNRITESLRQKDKQLEAENRKLFLLRLNMLEEHCEKLEDMDDYEKSLRDKAARSFTHALEENEKITSLALQSIEDEALEAQRKGSKSFRDWCRIYKEQLREHYKNLARQDLDKIEALIQRTGTLKTEIESMKTKLKNVLRENEKLKEDQQNRTKKRVVGSHYGDNAKTKQRRRQQNAKKIEQLQNENKELLKRISDVERQTDFVRSQFTRALDKVRQGKGSTVKPKYAKNKDLVFEYSESTGFDGCSASSSVSSISRVSSKRSGLDGVVKVTSAAREDGKEYSDEENYELDDGSEFEDGDETSEVGNLSETGDEMLPGEEKSARDDMEKFSGLSLKEMKSIENAEDIIRVSVDRKI